jgi:Domain of unknown function (DUF4124)
MLIANTATAEVYKCKGASGKVTMSDIPCDSTQVQAQVQTKEKPQTEQHKKDVPAQGDALEERILAAHTRECRSLRQQLSKEGLLKDGVVLASPQNAGKETTWTKYEASCLNRANDVANLYLAQKETARLEAVRKATCDAKANDYQKRQVNKANMTEKQTDELAILAAELARGCR